MTSFLQQGEEAEELGGMRAISSEGGGKVAGAGGGGVMAMERQSERYGEGRGVGGGDSESKQGP